MLAELYSLCLVLTSKNPYNYKETYEKRSRKTSFLLLFLIVSLKKDFFSALFLNRDFIQLFWTVKPYFLVAASISFTFAFKALYSGISNAL